MNRTVDARAAMIFVLLLVLVAATGCRQSDAGQAAAVDETVKDDPATTDAAEGETTSSEERGAVVRAGDGKAMVKSGEAEVSAGGGEVRAGDAVAGDGEARAGEVVAGDGEAEGERDGADARPGKVKLKIGGEPGTQFSGSCDIGGEKREVSGQVPGRFVYDLEGRGISCEIRNETGTGQLKFSVDIGGARKQKIKATADNVSFSFSGSSLSYTISSGSDASSVQKTKIISSSNSSVSSSSGSSR